MTSTIYIIPKYYYPTLGGLQNFTYRLSSALSSNWSERVVIWSPCSIRENPSDRHEFWSSLRNSALVHANAGAIIALGLEYETAIDAQLSTLLALQQKRVCSIISVRTCGDIRQRITRRRARIMSKLRATVVLNKTMAGECVADNWSITNATVIPPGLDLARFCCRSLVDRHSLRIKYGLPLNKKVILYTGRNHSDKGIDSVVAAWRGLLNPPCLWIVTDAYEPSSVSDVMLGHIMVSTGICESDIHEVYQAADVFVTGSIRDGVSNSILEAASAGLPLVACDLPHMRELASSINNYGVWLAPEREYHLFGECIQQALECQETHAGLRAKRLPFLSQFSLDRVTAAYVHILRGGAT